MVDKLALILVLVAAVVVCISLVRRYRRGGDDVCVAMCVGILAGVLLEAPGVARCLMR